MNYAVTNGKEQCKITVVISSHLLLDGSLNTDIDKACVFYFFIRSHEIACGVYYDF